MIGGADAEGLAGGERRHRVLGVVKPAQAGVVIQVEQHLAAVEDEVAVGKPFRLRIGGGEHDGLRMRGQGRLPRRCGRPRCRPMSGFRKSAVSRAK
jgi:hypothetical protein